MDTQKNWPTTCFRILLSLIFIVAGAGHYLNHTKILSRSLMTPIGQLISNSPISLSLLVYLSGAGLLIGGLSLLFNYKRKIASLVLIVILIPITLTAQTAGEETLGPLFKNIAILGGLIFFSFSDIPGSSNLKKTLSIIGFLIFSVDGYAKDTVNVVILVREPNHLEAAISTIREMKNGGAKLSANKAAIVVCGQKGIEALKRDSPLEKEIKIAGNNHIEIKACGLTLRKMKLKASNLLPSITIVENGLLEMIKLQHENYISVEL